MVCALLARLITLLRPDCFSEARENDNDDVDDGDDDDDVNDDDDDSKDDDDTASKRFLS